MNKPTPAAAPVQIALGLAIFFSGTAALVNQVVWQRGLKIFLGGSEALASTIVVLVFMLGLGAGAFWAGRRSSRLKNPLAAVATIEVLLFVINLAVALVLASDLRLSIVSMRIAANALGIPVELAYGGVSLLVLMPPCLLMGMTTPFAAEAFQRQLHNRTPRLLSLLFFANTIGSVLGAVVGSGWLLPRFGQLTTLQIAATANLACAVICVLLARQKASTAEQQTTAGTIARSDLVLSALLGGLSLGFELFLFRIVAVSHTPTPYVFAAALGGFLLYWSLGSALVARFEMPLDRALRIGALTAAVAYVWSISGLVYPLESALDLPLFMVFQAPLFLPSLVFGYAFGVLAARCKASWGDGVGLLYAWNTAGAAAGIIIMTAVGLSLPILIVLLIGCFAMAAASELAEGATKRASAMLVVSATLGVAALWMPWNSNPVLRTALYGRQSHTFQSHTGVIEVLPTGHMIWDGLWHSRLADGDDYIGTNNWFLAVAPLLAHGGEEIEDALVIGLGTGITASTLAGAPEIARVTSYDINHTLAHVHEQFADGTLHVLDNDKVDVVWADGRAALAQNDASYDLIQTQPMYLKQAGSTILNSKEFYELVSSRLKPGGVFCLYANGSAEQAYLVRQTAGAVFEHRASFFDGYLLVLSNDPIDLTPAKLARQYQRQGQVWDQIRGYPATSTPERFLAWRDDQLSWGGGELLSTDDHPILEFPSVLSSTYAGMGLATQDWPTPTSPWSVTKEWTP